MTNQFQCAQTSATMHTWNYFYLVFLIGGVTVIQESSAQISNQENATSENNAFFDEYFEWKYAIYNPEAGKFVLHADAIKLISNEYKLLSQNRNWWRISRAAQRKAACA